MSEDNPGGAVAAPAAEGDLLALARPLPATLLYRRVDPADLPFAPCAANAKRRPV